MIDPFYESHVTQAGYVEERLRPWAALVSLALIIGFAWAAIVAIGTLLF